MSSLLNKIKFFNISFIFLIYSQIKSGQEIEFLNIKKISLFEGYFVVLDSGLYLYNNNFLECSLIINFNSSVYRIPENNKNTNKINITELKNDDYLYILCLVNEYLFIFNAHNNKTFSYKLNEINITNNDDYCNILPYKIEDNKLSFILPLVQSSNFSFYIYNVSLIEHNYEKIKISFDDMIIYNNQISCQINSYLSDIQCFYNTEENNNKLFRSQFVIKNNSIIKDKTDDYNENDAIYHIRSAKSYNDNIFICITFGNERNIAGFIKENETNGFSPIEICSSATKNFKPNYKVLYFQETNEFMMTSRESLHTVILNNYNFSVTKCMIRSFTYQTTDYSIIFNNTFNDYNVINYDNFTNKAQCKELLIKEDNIIPSTENNQINIMTSIYKLETSIITVETDGTEKSSSLNYIIDSNTIMTTEINQINIMTSIYKLETSIITTETNKIEKSTSLNYIIDTNTIMTTENNQINIMTSIYKLETSIITAETNKIEKSTSLNYIIDSNTIISNVLNISKEEILNNIGNILTQIKTGVYYEMKGEDFTMIIKPTNTTPLSNKTHVEFDECEYILRQKYNISNSSIITFLQIEINNDNENSLYNQIKYFLYDDQKRELDLSICNDITTQIHYAIKNDSKLDISSISDFKKLGIDIMNAKDKFFTDLCFSFSDSNKDMILEDRIKYIYQNYSLCETGCTYDSIDIVNMNIACNCKIQGNNNMSILNVTPLYYEQQKEASFFDSNIGVMKCFNLVFSMKNKISNIGFFYSLF